jgi:dihydroneopterin aldolase
MKGRILLNDLEFHAHHGVYAHERENGQAFKLNIALETDLSAAAQSDDIHQALNYVSVYSAIEEEMKISSNLLENAAMRIVKRLKLDHPAITCVDITLTKVNPPIEGIKGGVSIHLIV